jgi:hypothetical protein
MSQMAGRFLQAVRSLEGSPSLAEIYQLAEARKPCSPSFSATAPRRADTRPELDLSSDYRSMHAEVVEHEAWVCGTPPE